MTYKIICDSCTDLPNELYSDPHFQMIPLTLYVGDEVVIDDETFDRLGFIDLVNRTETAPRSACPSAGDFLKAYEETDADMIFVVTLSKELSGSYNAARLARDMYFEEHGKRKIYVINSMSASCGQGLIAMKIQKMCELGNKFDDIVEFLKQFVLDMKTWFVLESLDTFEKNGRLTGLKYKLVTALNIKPIMSAELGNIVQVGMGRGVNKALKGMVEMMRKHYSRPEELEVSITHCNNPERADLVKGMIQDALHPKNIYVVETKGVSTMYANDGGIIVSA